MDKKDLTKLNLNYDSELGVVFHWSKRRGWTPLKRHVQNSKDNAYYVFKHEGKAVAVREETILKAWETE